MPRLEPTARPVVPLIEESAIRRRVDELASSLAERVAEDASPVVVVGILDGAATFTADLTRALSRAGVRQTVGFLGLASYGDAQASSGEVRLIGDTTVDVRGRTVVLLDGILDSGRTLDFATRHMRERGAERVLTVVLLDKPSRRRVAIQADLVGFPIADRFVVGYGMDAAGAHRELPFVGVLDDGSA